MGRRLGDYLRRTSTRPDGTIAERWMVRVISLYRKFRVAVGRSDDGVVSRLYLRWRSLERSLVSWRYGFVTFAELVEWTNDWIRSFPKGFDVVVGIPRSGLLVASIVALKLGKPLTTPELLAENRYWRIGRTGGPVKGGRLLLIDDSMSTGETFGRSLALVRSACPGSEVTKAALIVTPEAKALVDLYYIEIPHPRLFEWNMLHVKKGVLASDMDGVICENCPPGVDADEGAYVEWIRTARPYLIPTFEIEAIVTSRLERYRKETEEWLARHGVRYGQLVLWNVASKGEARGKHTQYKIETLLRLKPEMYWESSVVQAREIWRATRIPTVCIDELRLFA